MTAGGASVAGSGGDASSAGDGVSDTNVGSGAGSGAGSGIASGAWTGFDSGDLGAGGLSASSTVCLAMEGVSAA